MVAASGSKAELSDNFKRQLQRCPVDRPVDGYRQPALRADINPPRRCRFLRRLLVAGKDILRNSIFQSPLFYGMSRTLSQLVAPDAERSLEAGQGLQVKAQDCRMALLCADRAELGSNAFAVSPTGSSDGATRLIANSHQPLSGILAWLEASVSSDEGLNFTGGAFPGSPMLLLGTNPDFGWAATVNRPDLIDTSMPM